MPTERPGGLRAALGHRDFRLLMIAFGVSGAGSWAYNVALTAYVFERTHSAAWAGAVTIGRFLPTLLLGAYSGVLAERFERVRLMVSLDLACCGLMACLAAVAALRGPALLAIAFGAASSVVASPYLPAVTAITPQLVHEDDLAAANTVRSTIDNLVIVAGPGLGALLLVLGSPTAAFAANAASFLASAVVVSAITACSRPVDVTEGGTSGPWRQMLVGIRALAGSGSAVLLVVYCLVTSFIYGTDTVLFVVVSQRRLDSGAHGYGYLLAGLGIGGIIAAAGTNRIAARSWLGPVILVGMSLYCLPTLLLLVIHQAALAVAVEVLRGAGTLVVDVLAMTSLQRAVPEDRLGRVFGVFWTLVLVAICLGALITPLVLRLAGLDSALWLMGAGVPLLCLLGWPSLSRMDARSAVLLASIADRISVLERAAILHEAPRAALERLATGSTEIEVTPGTDVVVEGATADALYVIEEGEMRVSARHGEPVARQLATLGPGEVFGEIGLLERIPRTATVTAVSPSRLLRIEGQVFVDVLANTAVSPGLLGRAEARLGRALSAGPARPQPGPGAEGRNA